MSIDKFGHFCGYPDYYVSELELDFETRVVRLFENFGRQRLANFQQSRQKISLSRKI